VAIHSVYAHASGDIVAVPDRFSFLAALLPPVYAVLHGLWLMLGLWVLGVALVAGAGFVLGEDAGFWLYVLGAVLAGFEAPTLRRLKLRRRGFSYRGELLARNEDEAVVGVLSRVRPR